MAYENGIVIGCDSNQEWLLPWWWKHYSLHNSFPVIFVDFGMSENGLSWCREKGECMSIKPMNQVITSKQNVSPEQVKSWEYRYGKEVWKNRTAFLKKPFALLQSPFPSSLWLDLDCQVRGSLEPLFHTLNFGAEIALVKDEDQNAELLLPGEVCYNSGVIAFKRRAKILSSWAALINENVNLLPGDQEYLSRAIFLNRTPLFELSPIYNWPTTLGLNHQSIIQHFCDPSGKLAILKSLHKNS